MARCALDIVLTAISYLRTFQSHAASLVYVSSQKSIDLVSNVSILYGNQNARKMTWPVTSL